MHAALRSVGARVRLCAVRRPARAVDRVDAPARRRARRLTPAGTRESCAQNKTSVSLIARTGIKNNLPVNPTMYSANLS